MCIYRNTCEQQYMYMSILLSLSLSIYIYIYIYLGVGASECMRKPVVVALFDLSREHDIYASVVLSTCISVLVSVCLSFSFSSHPLPLSPPPPVSLSVSVYLFLYICVYICIYIYPYLSISIIFLSQKLWHFPKNTRSCVENECCCPRTVNISNVNFTSKISIPPEPVFNNMGQQMSGPDSSIG